MHRLSRVIALALLLAVTLVPTSAFASPPPAHTAPGVLSAAWEPLTRLWGWLAGQAAAAPFTGRRAAPRAVPFRPAARTDEGIGADPNGGSSTQAEEGAEADPYGS